MGCVVVHGGFGSVLGGAGGWAVVLGGGGGCVRGCSEFWCGVSFCWEVVGWVSVGVEL